VFAFMVLAGVLLAVLSYTLLPETHPSERRTRLHAGSLARTLFRIATSREFMLYALALGISFAAMVTFIGAAPAVVETHWHLGETQFAWLFVPLICGIIGGSLLSRVLAGRLPGRRQIGIGYALALSGAGITVLLHATTTPPVLVQQVLIATMATGVQLMMPIFFLRMMDLFPEVRGTAASVQSCVMLGIGAIFIGGLVPAISGSMLTLSMGSFLAAFTGFCIWRFAWRRD
jgi:DHA1 family bicyclomycin/chloramphenicol resistance-like MFS transporter